LDGEALKPEPNDAGAPRPSFESTPKAGLVPEPDLESGPSLNPVSIHHYGLAGFLKSRYGPVHRSSSALYIGPDDQSGTLNSNSTPMIALPGQPISSI